MGAVSVEAGVKIIGEFADFQAAFHQMLVDVANDPAAAGLSNQLIEDILSQHIKFKPSGSGGGNSGLLAGAVGGATAAGILMLADAIKDMTKQSKIVATTQDAVAKATGLLIDMILIPFIPLITYGIINLYKSITSFGAEWKKDWKGEVAEIIIDSIINIFNPFVHVLEVLTGFDITDYFHHMLLSNEAWNAFVKEWDSFMKNPLGELKTAFSNFIGDAGTYFQNGLRAILNWLLEQPLIGAALSGLGFEKQMMRKTPSQIAQDLELTNEDYMQVYGARNPTTQTKSTAGIGTEGNPAPGVTVMVYIDGKFIDPAELDQKIENKVGNMNWNGLRVTGAWVD